MPPFMTRSQATSGWAKSASAYARSDMRRPPRRGARPQSISAFPRTQLLLARWCGPRPDASRWPTRPRARQPLLPLHHADELLEAGELRLDHVDGALVLELERRGIELLRREAHDNLGPAEPQHVDRG